MANVNETNNSIYTEDELSILERGKKVRLSIVDNMTKDGMVPDRVGDIRVLNEVVSGLEKSVHDSANNRLKLQDSQNQEAVAENVAELLKQMAMKKPVNKGNRVIELSESFVPVDIVPGETEVSPEQLDIQDFTGEGE